MLQHGSRSAPSYLRPLKKKGFKEERVTIIGLYAIGKSTTLASNKSLREKEASRLTFPLRERRGSPALHLPPPKERRGGEFCKASSRIVVSENMCGFRTMLI